jgi:hypothetical protein
MKRKSLRVGSEPGEPVVTEFAVTEFAVTEFATAPSGLSSLFQRATTPKAASRQEQSERQCDRTPPVALPPDAEKPARAERFLARF